MQAINLVRFRLQALCAVVPMSVQKPLLWYFGLIPHMLYSGVRLRGVLYNSLVLKVFALLLWVCPMHAQLRVESGICASSYTELTPSPAISFFVIPSTLPTFRGTFSQLSGQKYRVPWRYSHCTV